MHPIGRESIDGAPKNIPALTGVRGFAALWVVIMHYVAAAPQYVGTWFYQSAQQGFTGVIVFLALSGAVLAHCYHQNFRSGIEHADYVDYLRNRIARIYPLHVVTLLAFVLLVYIGYPILKAEDTGFSFALNLLLIHAWGFVNEFTWNALSWTISVELAAYFVFPFVVRFLFRAPRWVAGIALVACIFVIWANPYPTILARLGIDVIGLQLRWGYFLFQFGTVFVAGVALYRLADNASRWPLIVSDVLVLSGLAILTYLCSLIYLPHWLALTAGLLIIAGLLSRNSRIGNLLFGNRLSVFIGEISYSLYMTHFLLNVIIAHSPATTNMEISLRVILAIGLAFVSYTLIENPARMFFRSRHRLQKIVAA